MPITAPVLTTIVPGTAARIRAAMGPEVLAQLAPQVAAVRRQAALMTDDEFYGWDTLYADRASLVDLRLAGACGGGGCNESFSNSQFWKVDFQCSADVYARILFQYTRYVAAQVRLERLLANPPQAWVTSMYFSDVQDAWGRSTSLAQPPASAQPMSAKAEEWADWCMEVARTIAVAQWATNVRWCNGERVPEFYSSHRTSVKDTSDFSSTSTRPAAPSEIGTIACERGAMPRVTADFWSGGTAARCSYFPDCAPNLFGGYGPLGYFKPTSARGASMSRWTIGFYADAATLSPSAPHRAAWDPAVGQRQGICETHVYGSPLQQGDVFKAFRGGDGRAFLAREAMDLTSSSMTGAVRQFYTPTIIQLSPVLALRRSSDSPSRPYVMPRSMADFDPIAAPSLVNGRPGPVWPENIQQPTSTNARDMLVALFKDADDPTYHAPSADEFHSRRELKVFWNLNWCSQFGFTPGGMRQVWWLMAHAYDVMDTSMGQATAQAFNNFLVALNQIPEQFRTTIPLESQETVRALAQQNLDAIYAGIQTAAGVVAGVGAAALTIGGPFGAAVGVALEVVALLMQVAALLAKTAQDTGLARAENPPILPTIVVRSAGVTNDPTDPCWLVPSNARRGGGASSMVPKATAVRDAALQSDDPSLWYEQVRQAIATGQQPPPDTTPQVNKGVALGAGAIAGLALVKLLGG